ncbi:O2 contryphan Vc1-like [Littorina saxatilis]|uniref:Uncharacterized protein n=1 Tax=Littorina saxatilis TaxID=31220 RepID=A0AAN9BQR5_9CAEN
MSKVIILCVVFAALTVFLIEETRAEQVKQRVKRQGMTLDDYPADDVDMMQRIFRTPLKRQWCRSGMSYNPVLGSCTLSLAAMRGRGRGYRGQ